MEQIEHVQQGDSNKAVRFFKWLGQKMAALFEPEEVEVTFDTNGHYTYTKPQSARPCQPTEAAS